MNLPFFIAKRYLFARKSRNVINLISGISLLGIGVGAMALIVVLSTFNGMRILVEDLYSSFDPEIRIEPAQGKTFAWDEFPEEKLREHQAVRLISRSIQETVLLRYREAQFFVTLKGVDSTYLEMTGLDSMMYSGDMKLRENGKNYCIVGYGVADQLSIFLSHMFEPVKVYAAKRTAKVTVNPQDAFLTDVIYPAGIFAINPEFDYQYVLAPYEFSAELLQHPGRVSSVEVGLVPGADMDQVARELKEILGDDFQVKSRYQLNEVLYQTNQTEKWITFMILSFVLGIAAFNLIGSISMVIIDKREDIYTLQAMGLRPAQIRRLFLLEGMMVSALGGGGGLVIGAILCILQSTIGLVKLQTGAIVEYYPVSMEWADFLAVSLIVIVIGFIAAWLPAFWGTRKYLLHK
ncbi:ABC transporter permease [bacterium SCSIO 12741]|nr:ABC transporter permease [bacterium SCSIO 12741]